MAHSSKSIFWQVLKGFLGSASAVAPVNYSAVLIPPTPDNAWRLVGHSLGKAAENELQSHKAA
jgi:hypothetical protein